jgi:succinate-semialdehyde dehydrogenase/glutarate-semialdehyde dehydrogenase
MTASDRSKRLRRWYDLVLHNKQDLANIIVAENGKPLAEALGEVQYAASFIEWFAEEAKRCYGLTIPSPFPHSNIITLKQPVGVCAMITPWNFPLAMITRKLAPALAAGCTAIVKPSPETPLSALAVTMLAEAAGIPPGVIQVLPTSREGTPALAGPLLQDPRVRKVSVTGSTAVGKLVAQQASTTLKRLSLELGGNAPFIVFRPTSSSSGREAYVTKVVEQLVQAKLRNSGQTCVSPNRIFVHQQIHDQVVKQLKAAVEAMPVGSGYEKETRLGPLISDAAVDKLEQHINGALCSGAQCVTGGQRIQDRFFAPTILTKCSNEMQLSCEESFGPLFSIFGFESEADVIEQANATDVGLAGYVFTEDHAQAWRMMEQLQVGMVGVNRGLISTEVAPFGGIKQSGMGREGSVYGLDEYTQLKYVCMSQ